MRHEERDAPDVERVVGQLEHARARLDERFPERLGRARVVVHGSAAQLDAAEPWLPLQRRLTAPAGRRYLVGWAGERELHVLAPRLLAQRASNVEGSLELLMLAPAALLARRYVAANHPGMPPPFGPRTFARWLRWAWLLEGAAQYFSGQVAPRAAGGHAAAARGRHAGVPARAARRGAARRHACSTCWRARRASAPASRSPAARTATARARALTRAFGGRACAIPRRRGARTSCGSASRAACTDAAADAVHATYGVFAPRYRAMSIGVLMSVTVVAFQALGVGTVMPAVARELGGLERYGWAFSAFMLASVVGSVAAGQDADRAGPVRAYVGRDRARSRPAACSPRSPGRGRAAGGTRARGARRRRARRRHVRVGEPRVPAGDVRPHARADVLGLGAAVARRAGRRRADRRPHDLALGVRAAAAVPAGRGGAHAAGTAALSRAERRGRRRAGCRRRSRSRRAPALFLGALGLDEPLLLVPAAAAGLALALPSFRSLMPPGTLRAARGLPSGILVRGLLAVAFLGCDAFLPLALTELRGFSVSQAGLVISAASLSWSLGSFLQARLDRLDGGTGRPRAAAAPGSRCCWPGSRRRRPGVIARRRSRSRSRSPAGRSPGSESASAIPRSAAIVLSEAPGGEEGSVSAALQLIETIGVAVFTGIGGVLIALGARPGLGRGDGAGAGVRRRRRRGGGGAGGGAACGAGSPPHVDGGIEEARIAVALPRNASRSNVRESEAHSAAT